jgi:hypothetical protein
MKTRRLKRVAVAACGGVLLGALAGPAFAQCHTRIADPIPGRIPASALRVTLDTVLNHGLVAPVTGAVAPGLPNRIFIVDQTGKIWSLEVYGPRRGEASLFLDMSSFLVPLGLFAPLNYDERGLLGLAFHPDFERNGFFYTFSSEPASGHKPDFTTSKTPRAPLSPGEVEEQSVVRQWQVIRSAGGVVSVDPKSSRVLLRIAKPQFNHNGGTLAFGPDRMLYISLGDGGNANDEGPGHVPGGNAQSLAPGNVLGKILRIDPLGRNAANGQYGIPADNPFVGKPGADEIYARGFRNPYRMSFDKETAKLWAGDVGQNDVEEVDNVSAGRNYGWPIKEGTFLFDDGACKGDHQGYVYRNSPGAPAGLTDPIAQYDHRDGASAPETRVAVVGGYVYRGKRIDGLEGRYVFGDYSAELGDAANGHMFVLGAGRRVTELVATNRHPLKMAVLGWVQDQRGELYVLSNRTGTVTGATGAVMKLSAVGHEDDGAD